MRLYVPLTLAEIEGLQAIAWSERRPLRDQAAWLLSQAIQREAAMARRRQDRRTQHGEVARVANER